MRPLRLSLRQFVSIALFLAAILSLNATMLRAQAPPRLLEAVDNTRRVTLTGNTHPLARAEFDHGAADDALPMTRMLLLLSRSDAQEAELQAFMEQQQDKSSANYHAWLTPAQFGAQYGPADADVQAVTQWLGSQGFRIEKVYSNKLVIEFSGNAGQVRNAFGAAIRNYEVNGKTYVANANDPQIPAALAPVVAGIVSLNNFPRQSHVKSAGIARKIPGEPGLHPLFTIPTSSSNGYFYALGPGDFATIYNSKGLIAAQNDGTGQTIAIVGETNINVTDVQNFRSMFGLPATFTAANVLLNGEDPGITSTNEETEADLDTQWSGAVAPGATVYLVVSASTPASQGVDLSALYIVEHNLADVMSESYGACEAGLGSAANAFYNSLWQQAAAQGITAVVSSGDNGSAGCDDPNTETTAQFGLAVSGLASTPYNVAAGGTDFDQVNHWSTYWSTTNSTTGTDTIGTSALSYIPEIPWNQNCSQIALTGCGASAPGGSVNLVAGSGGQSSQYGKPSWQLGVTGMPNDSHRDLPDISLFASPGFDGSGYIVCQQDQTYNQPCTLNLSAGAQTFVVGGTSASAPAFAGVMALVNQKQATAQNPAPRQGNANYVLYALAKRSGASCTSSATEAANCIFNDVTHGNSVLPTGLSGIGTNSVPCAAASPNCSVVAAGQTGVLVEPATPTVEAWTVTPGYDLATGLGSVNIANLAGSWGTVNTVATTTTLTLTPSTGITHGNENVSVNVSVSVPSGKAAATGEVSLIAKLAGPNGSTTQGLDEFTLSGGKASGTTNSLPGGSNYQVYAHYAGDGTNAPSDSAPQTVTVAPEASQTFIVIPTFDSSGNQLSGNTNSVTYGSNYTIRMYVTNKNGAANPNGAPSGTCDQINMLTCPTGTVTLTDNGALLGTGGGGTGIYNLNSAGYTRDLTANLTGGTHAVAAVYSGDNSYQQSVRNASVTVTPAPTQTIVDSYLVTVKPGQTFQIEANVTGLGPRVSAYPGGTVTFYDGNTPISGAVQITQGANAQIYADIYNVTFATPGPHTITANYGGDANYAPSTSAAVTSTLLISTVVTQTVSATNIQYGQTVALTAVVTSNAKGPAITNTLYFQAPFPNVSNIVATPGVDPNGNQMLTVTATLTPPGTEPIAAIFQGDGNYAPSSAQSTLITVNIPDFTLTPSNGLSLLATGGQAATTQLMVAPVQSTQPASTVMLSLYLSGGSIPGYTLALSPQQVSLNGAPVAATLSLSPNASPSPAFRPRPKHMAFVPLHHGDRRLFGATAIIGLLLLLLLKHRKNYRPSLGLASASLVFLLMFGCGGSGSGTGSGGNGSGSGGGGGGSTPQATSIVLTTSNPKVPQYGNYTLTATVTASTTPTGTVTFYIGPWAQTVPLVGNQAQLSASSNLALTNIPAMYQITATYDGDPLNLPSTSAAVPEVVTGTIPFTIMASTGLDLHQIQGTYGLQ